MSIKLLYIVFVSFFHLYKEYSNCLISFLSFSELFLAFNWDKKIDNLLSIWFGVRIFSPCPSYSANSCLLNFVLSAILSSKFGSDSVLDALS